MYVRLAFDVAAHLEPEILIVDEVLAVGDAQFQKKCLGKMEEVGKEGRTVLFVSHNVAAISNLYSITFFIENIGFAERDLRLDEGFRSGPNEPYSLIINDRLLLSPDGGSLPGHRRTDVVVCQPFPVSQKQYNNYCVNREEKVSFFSSPQSKFEKLKNMPRYTPGNIKTLNWDLDFIDGPALWTCIDVLVNKKWNDFVSENNQPVILDCGANIGISVLNYKRQFPSAKIVAFEPDPSIINVLKRNLSKNSVDDVKVIEAAVWTQVGEIPFYCEGADGSRILLDRNCIENKTTVKTVDLACYVTEPVDLIKMDIEGAEFDVLLHLADKLDLVKNMVVECHIDNSKIHKFAQLLEVLANANFTVAINSYGAWRDLIHRPGKLPLEFDQYILVAAWR